MKTPHAFGQELKMERVAIKILILKNLKILQIQ